MIKHTSHSLEDTARIAGEWLERAASDSGKDEATVVGLSGHLGSGKTAFVKEVAKHLGVQEEITSPTFVIMKKYKINHPRWNHLVHIDAYRLDNGKEMETVGFEDIISDSGNLVMIEWPEQVEEVLGGIFNYIQIDFSITEGASSVPYPDGVDFNTRTIIERWGGQRKRVS